MYHGHLDVHPPEEDTPPRWMWHQDGGIQNRDLETDPRPRLSLKVAYFLTDLTETGHGNFVVLPGSHLRNTLARDDVIPTGATPILAAPGDAVIFDRRLWHMRSQNRSMRTRKALFYGYTYRWIRPRDDLGLDRETIARMTPIQRQLAGVDVVDAIDRWMPIAAHCRSARSSRAIAARRPSPGPAPRGAHALVGAEQYLAKPHVLRGDLDTLVLAD